MTSSINSFFWKLKLIAWNVLVGLMNFSVRLLRMGLDRPAGERPPAAGAGLTRISPAPHSDHSRGFNRMAHREATP